MALLTGRSTFIRFKVIGSKSRSFGEEHIERLSSHAAGKSRIASADGIEVGWTTGEHLLDTLFTLEKNIVNDALFFALRIDCDKIPADRFKAYVAIELAALSKDNPRGFASSKQNREAKEAARDRLEEEAKDGRYRKSTIIPVMWDLKTGEVLYGSLSWTRIDRFMTHFEQTFGLRLEVITAGSLAYRLAELKERTDRVDSAFLTKFTHDTPTEPAWIADDSSRDFLGNELLLWLWYYLDRVDDTITLEDKSDLTVMMARSLNLSCPRGQMGQDGFRSDGPTRLPEAKRAAQAGKLPRRAGMTIVRHDQQFELTLHAESLAIGTAKIPNPPEDVIDPRARLECRVDQLRFLTESLDMLFARFLEDRLDKSWGELKSVSNWLDRKTESVAA